MANDEQIPRRRASLELLRAEAADELSVLVHERLRVVYLLRAENIAADGGSRPNASRHYRVLRQIALDYPPLTRAVWSLLGDANTHRRWDPTVRAEAS